MFAFVVFVPMGVETWTDGSSPGKKLLGLRVVTTDGGPISFRHAAVRSLIQLVEIPTGLALVVALADSRTQRMGDLAAGTFVIKDIITSTEVQPIVFYPPRGLESFTALLDVSRVTARQFQAIRSLLLRVTQLDADGPLWAVARLRPGLERPDHARAAAGDPSGVLPDLHRVGVPGTQRDPGPPAGPAGGRPRPRGLVSTTRRDRRASWGIGSLAR